MPRPAELVELMRAGERFFLDQVASLDDAALDEPSPLAGWTRGHIVAHMARNADALRNLLTWARTGVETPMYRSAAARDEGIEATHRLGATALRADARTASSMLLDDVDALPAAAWDAPVRTARGREITVTEVPWMRIRESWVHAVDLGTGASFADLPPRVVGDFLDEVVPDLSGRDATPAVVIHATDWDRTWTIGPPSVDPVHVDGRGSDLLSWLIGRGGAGLVASSAAARLPELPRWL